jgi:TPR repeat protein
LGVISSWEELDPVEEEDVAAGMAEITTLAEGGNPRASYILALAYTKGQGVKRDEVAAEKYMHRAANHGVASAQLNMGFICARKTTQGEGAAASSEKEENDASAVAWFEKAAEQRDATAALNLGIMHEQGRGVPKNPENSFKFYLAAAVRLYI